MKLFLGLLLFALIHRGTASLEPGQVLKCFQCYFQSDKNITKISPERKRDPPFNEFGFKDCGPFDSSPNKNLTMQRSCKKEGDLCYSKYRRMKTEVLLVERGCMPPANVTDHKNKKIEVSGTMNFCLGWDDDCRTAHSQTRTCYCNNDHGCNQFHLNFKRRMFINTPDAVPQAPIPCSRAPNALGGSSVILSIIMAIIANFL